MAVTKSTDPIDILLEMGIDLDNLSEEEDYLSALKEAIAKIQFQTKGSGDERSAILSQEVIKVRKSRKAADPKFKAKTTKVSPDAFFNKKKPEEQAQPVPGQKALPGKGPAAIVKRQTIKPELFKKPEKPEEQKDNKDLKENNILKDILNTLNSILGTLKEQNKLYTKQAEKDRKAKEKKKRGAQEEKLESPLKKFLGAANKIVKPVKSFLDGLLEFFVKVFIGRLLVKLINWGSENGDKVDAILGFFEKTWPALLAVGLLFFTGLGGFIGNLIGLVAGFIPRLLGLVPQILKGALGLIKFVATNPFAAGAVLFGAGALIPKLFPDTVDAEEKKTKEAPGTNEEKIKALEEQKANLNPLERLQGVGAEIDEQIEFLKTGETAQYGKKFNKGGIVPGSGNTDSVRAMLTPGEFVMSKGAVQQYGLVTMKSMNAAGGGTNIPMVSGGITYAAGGGEIADPNEKLKPNDEPKNRPKGDHSHELGHIVGLDKVSGMVSKFAKSSLGNIMMPGIGPALSIAESLMGGPAQASEVKSSTSTSTPAPVTATPKTPAVSSSTKTEQPKKKGGNMFGGLMDAMTFNMFDFDGMGKPNGGQESPPPEPPSAPDSERTIGEADPNAKVEPLPDNFSDKQAFMHIYNIAKKVGGTKWPEIVAAQAMHETGYLKVKPSVYFATGKTNPFGQTGDRGYGTIPRAGNPAGWTKYPNLEEAVRDHIKLWHSVSNHPQNYNAHDTILDGIAAVAPAYSPNSDPANIRLGYTTDGYSAGMVRALKTGGFDVKTTRKGGAPKMTPGGSTPGPSSVTPSGSTPGPGGSTPGSSGPGGGSTGRFQSPGGPGSVGSKTSYGDYLKNLYGKKKSADGITPLPSSTMSKGKSAGGPSADAGKNPGNQMTSPDNDIPAINAEAMHSDEKIEVLGIEIS